MSAVPNVRVAILSGAFNPLSIAGLKLWLAADRLSGFADADPISSWADLSGGSNHLVQATGGKQPLFRAAIQNGRPIVRFDGTDDALQKAFTLNQPTTIFGVISNRDVSTNNRVLWDGSSVNTGSLRLAGVAPNIYNGFAGSTLTFINGPAVNVFGVFTEIWNGASSSLQLDSNAPTVSAGGASNMGGFTLGTDGALARASAIDVGEVLVYDSSLSTANQNAVRAYLKGRWGTP